MSKGVNKATVLGYLGQDPEVRYMSNGDAVTTISVATTEKWKDKTTGEEKEQTEWHRIVFYKKIAEIAGEYLKKGSQVYVEGKMKTKKWTDKENIVRYTTEVVGNELQMLGGSNKESANDQ